MCETSDKGFKDRTPADMRPREKMLRCSDSSELSDEDLLSLVLKTGTCGCDVWELSHRMLAAFHSLHEFVRADVRTMQARIKCYNLRCPDRAIHGVGVAKLLAIQAAFELVKRANRIEEGELRSKNLRSSSAAYQVFSRVVSEHPEQEHFFVLPMDSEFHPLCDPIAITKGTADHTIVHPRDVFREAIRWNAHSIIVAHNHPCGDPTPSDEDIEITRRLIEVGNMHAIPLLDHLVLGSTSSADGKGFVSVRNLAVLKF